MQTKLQHPLKWSYSIIFMCLVISQAYAVSNQEILDRELSLNLLNVTFTEALSTIEQDAQVKFMYSSDQVNINERISIQVKQRKLRDILNEVLLPRGIQYKMHEKESAIILTKKVAQSFQSEIEQHQPIHKQTVTGVVTDLEGQPMVGVSVYVKGTARGTITDTNGKYTIEAAASDALVFSFIGFKTVEVKVGSQAIQNITLQPDAKALDEVVINAGYWHVNKDEQTGNIARVTAADIEGQPVANTLMALQGRMAGVVITQTSGVAGAGLRVQIRGQNSLRNTQADNGNLPLYVIDGVPIDASPVTSNGALLAIGGIDPLNVLNPANIESIEVLKDADATAIYGSRGANGVMLITTKKGKAGSTQVDLQAYTGAGHVSKTMHLMNTRQYLAMRNEAFTNDGIVPKATDYDVNGTWDQTTNRNWQKELVGGTANISDVQAALTGGTETVTFRASLGMHKETTVFPGNFGYKKIMGSVSLRHASSNKKFTMNITVNYGLDDNRLFSRNIIEDALTLPPNAPLYNEQGNLDWTGYTADRQNPLSYFKITHTSNSASLITNAVVRYEIAEGLHISSSMGYTNQYTNQLIKSPKTSMHPNFMVDSKSQTMDFSASTWIAEPQLTYTRNIFNGKVDILMGATWQQSNSHNKSITATGFLSDNLLGNLRAAQTVTIAEDDKVTYRYNAFFGRLSYNWKEKYLLNLTARRDGSSRFGTDNQFGNFGAAGVAWVISNEDFLQHSTVVSFAKLRTSYGTTGSDYVGNYAYLNTYTPSSSSYSGSTILNTTALANPDFGWEVNKKFEAATEWGFFKDRIRSAVSWYRNRSSNQLVGYPLPATTGFNTVQYNLEATVQNTGWEVELNTINVNSPKGLFWKSSINFTLPRNMLVAYPGIEASAYANTYRVGEPLTISTRYKFLQVNPTTGLYEIHDADENGSISLTDRVVVVNMGRTMFAGFLNTIAYKGITVDFLIEAVSQTSNNYWGMFHAQPGSMYNQPAIVAQQNRWQAEGDEATLQKFTQVSPTSYTRAAASDRNQTDASFIRLKTIALAWNIPVNITSKIKAKSARVYAQAQNLLTLTKYPGLNPEFPYAQLPPLRVVTIGMQFKF